MHVHMHRRTPAPLLLLLLSLHPTLTSGSSSGDVYICDARSTLFGCDHHGLNDDGTTNRLNCTEDSPGVMHWALRPTPTSAYKIQAPTSDYVPDAFATVEVIVDDYAWKYRGLLLHAVDGNGNTVGKWGLPNEAGYPFWHPPICGEQYVLHNAAAEKALSSKFHFKTPPAGTGTLVFHGLFKKGPANEGSFHYPLHTLSLTEAAPPSSSAPTPSTWVLAQAAQSCNAACHHAGGLVCLDEELDGNSNAPNHQHLLEQLFPCSLQLSDGCSIGAPGASTTDENHCWYHDKAVCAATTATATTAPQCNATSAHVKRFCYCSSNPHQGRRRLASTHPTVPEQSNAPPPVSNSASNTPKNNVPPAMPPAMSSSAPRAPTFWLFLLAPLFACLSTISGRRRGHSRTAALLGMVTVLVLLAQHACLAHNWMVGIDGTRGKGASTATEGRRGTDVAAQVGPGQTIDFLFSTGHGADVYVLLVAGGNEAFLSARDKLAVAEEYIAQAPAGTNKAQHADYKRWHMSNRDAYGRWSGMTCASCIPADPNDPLDECVRVCAGQAGPAWYTRRIDSTHADYPELHKGEKGLAYEYNDEKIQHDVYISYNSDKYPFLEAVMKYRIKAHQPHDFVSVACCVLRLHFFLFFSNCRNAPHAF